MSPGRTLLPVSVLLACAAPASAQSLNVDVGTLRGTPTSAYAGAAGQPGSWFGYDIGQTSLALTDLSGGATSVTLSHNEIATNFSADNPLTGGDDDALMDDAQGFNVIVSTDTWTFTGLSPGPYEVYVYAWAPDVPVSFLTDVTVVGGSAGTQTCGGADWTGAHVLGSTYVVDTVTSTGSLSITVATASGFGSCNGIQLVEPCTGSVASYCSAGTTSSGCRATMGATGTPSLSNASPFTLTCTGVEGNKNGIFFYGISGRNAAPWGNSTSTLCVKSPTQRMNPPASSGGAAGTCGGAYARDWNAYVAANPGKAINQALSVGSTVNAQAWFRDPAAGTGPLGAKGTALSDGLEFTTCP